MGRSPASGEVPRVRLPAPSGHAILEHMRSLDRIGPAPASRPMAFLSDVHGNLRALNAVLEELTRSEITEIFVAGDLLLGGDEPLQVWKLLQSSNARCVRGTSDVALATIDPSQLRPSNPDEVEMAARFAATSPDFTRSS